MTELLEQLKLALSPTLKNHTSVEDPIYLVGPLLKITPSHLSSSNTVIFVDGGAKHKRGFGFAAGDGDSIDSIHKLDFVFPAEKDRSDLGLVLMAIKNSAKKFVLLGFSGDRRDHDLFNLGEINNFLLLSKNQTSVLLDNNIMFLSPGSWKISVDGLFSVGTLFENQISISGDCKYKTLAKTKFNPLESLGLSNNANGIIDISSTKPFFIYLDNSVDKNSKSFTSLIAT